MDAVSTPLDTAQLIPSDYRLRMPGPTAVPDRVRQAMALPVISHRGPEFRRILGDATQMLRAIIGTQDNIFFLGTSGTGGMETALANVLSPGDAVLVVVCGQFGERFVSIAQAMGVAVDQAAVPWGEAPAPDFIAGHLKRRKYRAVICVHNESSTGVVTDIAAIGKLLSGTDMLLIVDSVSGLGGVDVRMDDWGVDILIAASQKALMCPPGLAAMAVSRKAMAVIENASAIPRFYFDLRRAKASAKNNETAFTPPVSLIVALREALTMIHEEGLAEVLLRHRRLSQALQAGCMALGLPMLPPEGVRSATVTVAHVPDSLEGSAIVQHMYSRYHTVIAGQRTKLQNRVVRFGTMGAIGPEDIFTDLRQLEETLRDLGQPVPTGAGVRAAAALIGA